MNAMLASAAFRSCSSSIRSSTVRTEVRMRDRARIVLLAAEGVATREIGRIGPHDRNGIEVAGALRARQQGIC